LWTIGPGAGVIPLLVAGGVGLAAAMAMIGLRLSMGRRRAAS
jgi:hypothetical protein